MNRPSYRFHGDNPVTFTRYLKHIALEGEDGQPRSEGRFGDLLGFRPVGRKDIAPRMS